MIITILTRSIFTFGCTLLFLVIMMWLFGLRINLTGSMPLGIYQPLNGITVQRGDIVAVCLPQPLAEEGLRANILMHGSCPQTKVMPILKKVIAIPNDKLTITSNAIYVNNDKYLAPHNTISYLLPEKVNTLYWLYGTASERSWDSRYFGGVNRNTLIGIYKPVFTFNLSSSLSKPSRQAGRHATNH